MENGTFSCDEDSNKKNTCFSLACVIVDRRVCRFRQPLGLVRTPHLYLQGCGLEVTIRERVVQGLSFFPFIVKVTLIKKASYCIVSCTNHETAASFKRCLTRLMSEGSSGLSDAPEETLRLVQLISSVAFAEECSWYRSLDCLGTVDVCDSKDFVCEKSIIPSLTVTFLDPVVYGKEEHILCNILDRLDWSTAHRESEFLFQSERKLKTETADHYGISLEMLLESAPEIKRSVEKHWSAMKSAREIDSIYVTAVRHLPPSTHKQPAIYLTRESEVHFKPVVSYFALGGPAAVLFSSAENDSLENNSCNRTPLTAAIVLRPGHALTLAGSDMFRWAITSLHPKSLKRHDLCETSRSYLLCFRYLTAQGVRAHVPQFQKLRMSDAREVPIRAKMVAARAQPKNCPIVSKDILCLFENHPLEHGTHSGIEKVDQCKSPLLIESFKRQYVYDVYERIAHHFSHTRYRPWPQVAEFLTSLIPGSVVLDVGCGNGKYSQCNKNVVWIGTDRSVNLTRCCVNARATPNAQPLAPVASRPEVYVGDCAKLCLRSNVADACISIAVIHHLPTEQQRRQAIQELIRCVRPGGLILIYVWAVEQAVGTIGARTFEAQDVFVPWHLQNHLDPAASSSENNCRKDMLEEQSGTSQYPAEEKSIAKPSDQRVTLYRYYHLFTKTEISTLCSQEKNANVLNVTFDNNNWRVLMQKTL